MKLSEVRQIKLETKNEIYFGNKAKQRIKSLCQTIVGGGESLF
jgi:hypothetical protein